METRSRTRAAEGKVLEELSNKARHTPSVDLSEGRILLLLLPFAVSELASDGSHQLSIF